MLDNTKIERLADDIQLFIDTKVELMKLESVDKSAIVLAGVLRSVVIVSIAAVSVLFVSLALGFYLSELIGNIYSGFVLVSFIYFLLLLILLSDHKRVLETHFLNKIIGILLRNRRSSNR
jgi:hypothetical protein